MNNVNSAFLSKTIYIIIRLTIVNFIYGKQEAFMVDEHVIEALGKTRIVVRNGKVVEVGESRLTYCPIFGVTEREGASSMSA